MKITISHLSKYPKDGTLQNPKSAIKSGLEVPQKKKKSKIDFAAFFFLGMCPAGLAAGVGRGDCAPVSPAASGMEAVG